MEEENEKTKAIIKDVVERWKHEETTVKECAVVAMTLLNRAVAMMARVDGVPFDLSEWQMALMELVNEFVPDSFDLPQ